MVLAARDRGCVAELLVIASALSVPDPRERPLAKQQAADQAHLLFPRRALGFPVAAGALAVLRAEARREPFAPPAGRRLSRAVRLLPPAARMARRARAARGRGGRAGLEVATGAARRDRRRALPVDPRGAARGSARQCRLPRRRDRRVPRARAESASTSIRAPGWRRSGPSGCWPPSSWRPRGSSRAARRRSSPNGSRRSRAIA